MAEHIKIIDTYFRIEAGYNGGDMSKELSGKVSSTVTVKPLRLMKQSLTTATMPNFSMLIEYSKI